MATTDRYVSNVADIGVRRSRMPLRRRVAFSYFHGFLHPVGSPVEVLPGDTFKAAMSIFTRMSTPIVPFIDDIRQEVDCFFVPKRILFNKTKQFYGEAESFGVATKVIEPHVLPSATYFHAEAVSSLTTNILKSESFASAFGLVYDDASGVAVNLAINVLPIRAVLACFNEYYRDENYQDQYVWDKDATGSTNSLATLGGSQITGLSLLPRVNKDRDVFSSILPWQTKGGPVLMPLGNYAPVITTGSDHNVSYGLRWQNVSTHAAYTGNRTLMTSAHGTSSGQDESIGIDAGLAPVNLIADLRNATAANISDLLYSLAYQDFLAKAAHFGTRYREYIYSMFGTKIADASEDIPEYLGRLKLRINVNQVVQTTGFQASSSTELGSLGAYSNSGNTGVLFHKSFTEPGYVVFLAYTKHQRTYSSGIDRVFLKTELLDYYQPPFANIADVPVGSYDIWLERGSETPLGFQEPWFDYRSLHDRVYGMLSPKIDTLGEIWTLAEKYSAKPIISASFMIEDRDAIARVLATGVNGPDYLVDTVLDIDATRVMPLFASGRLQVM